MNIHGQYLRACLNEMRDAAADNAMWHTWHSARVHHAAVVEFPLGELTNKAISGFVWVWKTSGTPMTTGPITAKDHFGAQGLEGKVSVNVNLTTAMIVANNLPLHRVQIQTKPRF